MPLPPTLHCGPAGWSHPDWNGIVYPKTGGRGFHALQYLARYFDAIEINTSFHQPLRPEISRLWIGKVEENTRFLFTAKLQRRFTHERVLDESEVALFKDGLWPLLRARRLGCVLMQFPWTFRFTEENRNFLIRLRRTFHEFPLVAEMRHASWTHAEALGTLIDYRVGFCNIDQAPYTKAMPPTSHLTSDVGYIRLHGRNPRDWTREFGSSNLSGARHDYLYSHSELSEWQPRIDHVREHAARTFVVANNEIKGKSVVNALQLSALLGDQRRSAPAALLARYPRELAGYRSAEPMQADLFDRAVA